MGVLECRVAFFSRFRVLDTLRVLCTTMKPHPTLLLFCLLFPCFLTYKVLRWNTIQNKKSKTKTNKLSDPPFCFFYLLALHPLYKTHRTSLVPHIQSPSMCIVMYYFCVFQWASHRNTVTPVTITTAPLFTHTTLPHQTHTPQP